MPQHSKVALLTESDGPHLDIYIDCLAAAPGVSEVSVADSSGSVFERVRSKLSRKFRDIPTYRDTQALLRERAPDLAVVGRAVDLAVVGRAPAPGFFLGGLMPRNPNNYQHRCLHCGTKLR